MESSNTEYLRGTLKTIVLGLLAEKERMYGYEITQAVKERTSGEIVLTFGSLYPLLYKLEQEGLVQNESEEVEGRLRKYYALTTTGRQTARQKLLDFTHFTHLMNRLMQLPLSLATPPTPDPSAL
ncbi:PadR family transcriptional regulator [Siphonobacter curvatus]|uniref:PadR family transcriptional regulator n=1 Tax=Siphonobacter curvatus TaxID=2094562 RepID=A0A2S7IF37_9BACT|nr:PadR family transcriptional regulator [Siphonobacter curvatus]PQA53437.1 PadR family transcriptional regulator [Siphonobacter curvatus]